jgi:hypothetical protein
MDARFRSWALRYPIVARDGRVTGWDDAGLRAVRSRAERLEIDVCRAAGITPEAVRRLAWTAAAFRAAREWGGSASGRDEDHR